jgi:hypothetical protein
MEPTEEDYRLLAEIIAAGGSVQVGTEVDHRPYFRLVKLNWLSSRNLTLRDTVYSVTPGGRRQKGRS